jgi:hypothetical protein
LRAKKLLDFLARFWCLGMATVRDRKTPKGKGWSEHLHQSQRIAPIQTSKNVGPVEKLLGRSYINRNSVANAIKFRII